MKKMIALILVILILPVVPAFAHTGLEDSFPKNGEVVTEPISELVLTFESKIENGSTLVVKTPDGETINPEEIKLENNELRATVPALENKVYSVVWKVIGADGHPIEGEYSFTLNAPVVPDEQKNDGDQNDTVKDEAEKDQTEVTDEKEETDQAADNVAENKTTESESATKENNRISSTAIVVAILVLILLAISFSRFTKRRK